MKDKRKLIVKSAFKIFSEKGYYNTKIEEIAEDAGVGKGTVYSYFKSKQDLYDTMVFWFLENYFHDLEKDINEKDDIEVIINKFILNHIQSITKTKTTFLKIMMEFSNLPRTKDEVIEFHKKFFFDKTERFTKIFQKAKDKGELRDINPQLVATFFLEALKGISQAIIISDKDQDGEKIAREVTDLLCYGIIKKVGN